jgi:hypothetical protein
MVHYKQLFNNFVRFIPLHFIYKNKQINSSKTELFYYRKPSQGYMFRLKSGHLQAVYNYTLSTTQKKCTRNIVEAFVSKVPTRETICASSEHAKRNVSVPTVWLHGYQHWQRYCSCTPQIQTHMHAHTAICIMIRCWTALSPTFISVRLCNKHLSRRLTFPETVVVAERSRIDCLLEHQHRGKE